MQLGFVSAILPELSLQEVLQVASQLQYDCVELMCWPVGKSNRRYAGVTHVDVDQLDDATVRNYHEWVAESGIVVSGLGYYPNPLSADRDEADRAAAHIRKVIDGAARLGLRQVNSFVGRDWTKTIDANWDRFLEVWRPIVAHAESCHVRIGIENCPMFFSNDEWPGGKNLAVSPKVWRRMFQDIPSDHFGLNYDPSHLTWQMMDYVAPLIDFSDRMFHLHAKDARLDRRRLNDVGILANPAEYHVPKLPGLGDIDWGHFIAVLGESGYRGPVCVEVEDRTFEDSLQGRLAALQQSVTYLRNFIPRRNLTIDR